MPDDYAETLRRQRKRRALIMAAVMFFGVLVLVVVLKLASDEMATPPQPLGSFSLTREQQSFTVEVPTSGRVALWIEVEQIHQEVGWTGSPPGAPVVIVETDGQTQRCATTDVVAFGHLSRAGGRVSWNGKLDRCHIAAAGGSVTLTAWWEQAADADAREGVTVERVVLTPSLEE